MLESPCCRSVDQRAPVDIDELARTTGLSIRSIRIALIELDLAGRIERHGHQLVSLATGLSDPA